MHFDAHVASDVSENDQHIGDKFCVDHGLIVAKKVLHDQNNNNNNNIYLKSNIQCT